MRILRPCFILTAFALAAASRLTAEDASNSLDPQRDRSPVDVVVDPQQRWLATANQTSDSVTLIELPSGRVLQEIAVGRHPEVIELAPDGQTLLVSCSYSGTIELLRLESGSGERLSHVNRIFTGFHPHGIAVTADGALAYVALCASDEVAVIDLSQQQVVERIAVGRWPRYLVLSPDGSRLAVGTSGDRGVSIVDTATRKTLYTEQFMGLNIGHMKMSRDGMYAYFPWMVYRHNPVSVQNIRLGWVLASRIARVRLDGPARREALSLDPPGRAVADPFGLDLTSDEQTLVVSASGTHELLVLRMSDAPLRDYGGTDHLPEELRSDPARFDRIELGGRPMGLYVADDDRTVYVANYLENAVQVVDLHDKKLTRNLHLGGPDEPSLERRGEAIFYDARRSLDQWYSCHSCHYQGGTNSERMDTENDGTRYTFKTVLPLYHLAETAPWTWHGWQEDLTAAVRKSMTSTMQSPAPADEDVEALVAFFRTLTPPPNPYRKADGSLSPAAERGKIVFESARAGCANCHTGPYFTDGQLHDVGLGSDKDRYPTFNTPSLIGVYAKAKLLHDGRASTLEEVLTGPHNPEHVMGEGPLTDQQRQDLIEYLKSL